MDRTTTPKLTSPRTKWRCLSLSQAQWVSQCSARVFHRTKIRPLKRQLYPSSPWRIRWWRVLAKLLRTSEKWSKNPRKQPRKQSAKTTQSTSGVPRCTRSSLRRSTWLASPGWRWATKWMREALPIRISCSVARTVRSICCRSKHWRRSRSRSLRITTSAWTASSTRSSKNTKSTRGSYWKVIRLVNRAVFYNWTTTLISDYSLRLCLNTFKMKASKLCSPRLRTPRPRPSRSSKTWSKPSKPISPYLTTSKSKRNYRTSRNASLRLSEPLQIIVQ